MNRDPRREPAPGDVLRAGSWTREVQSVNGIFGYEVRYVRTNLGTGNKENRHCITHEGWWRWARNAEVLTVGDKA